MREIPDAVKQNEIIDNVNLKPFNGIRPGVYLSILYALILIGIFFAVLLLPGIIRPTAAIVFNSEPQGAALRVDGSYMGTSPDIIRVSKGYHTLEAVLPGFNHTVINCDIPSRAFASLFFPKPYPVEIILTTSDPAGAFALAAADYAAWSFGGEPTIAWQIPLSLSEGVYRTGPLHNPELDEILNAAVRFTGTRAALRDLVRAKTLLDNGGLAPSLSLTASLSDIIQFLSENPGTAAWLSALLPSEAAAVVKSSAWFTNEAVNTQITGNSNGTNINVAGLSFSGFGSFYICDTPITDTLYETFLSENPQSESDDYPGELVKTGYITAVSWYAANAFCEWLSEKLPPSVKDHEIRLPTEAEWKFAAINSDNWEWCADPYTHFPRFAASASAIERIGSPERVLCGPERASLPPDFLSPFVTFRPVIAEKVNSYGR
jgi:hypothetical protein